MNCKPCKERGHDTPGILREGLNEYWCDGCFAPDITIALRQNRAATKEARRLKETGWFDHA